MIEFLYGNAGNAVTVHLCDGEATATVLNTLGFFRDVAELKKQKPSERFEARFGGQGDVVASL